MANGIFGSSDYFLGTGSNWDICKKSELNIFDALETSFNISCGNDNVFNPQNDIDDMGMGGLVFLTNWSNHSSVPTHSGYNHNPYQYGYPQNGSGGYDCGC